MPKRKEQASGEQADGSAAGKPAPASKAGKGTNSTKKAKTASASGGKAAKSGAGADSTADTDKKQRAAEIKKERNRIAARDARIRKKEHMKDLETKYNAGLDKNLSLKGKVLETEIVNAQIAQELTELRQLQTAFTTGETLPQASSVPAPTIAPPMMALPDPLLTAPLQAPSLFAATTAPGGAGIIDPARAALASLGGVGGILGNNGGEPDGGAGMPSLSDLLDAKPALKK